MRRVLPRLAVLPHCPSNSGFFLRMTTPSSTEVVSGRYSSVASSARSPMASSTGVVCVWKPVILWGGAGAPGGTVRRAAVRKRGSGSISLY